MSTHQSLLASHADGKENDRMAVQVRSDIFLHLLVCNNPHFEWELTLLQNQWQVRGLIRQGSHSVSEVCLHFSGIRVDKERTDYEESALARSLFTDNEAEDFNIFEVR